MSCTPSLLRLKLEWVSVISKLLPWTLSTAPVGISFLSSAEPRATVSTSVGSQSSGPGLLVEVGPSSDLSHDIY